MAATAVEIPRAGRLTPEDRRFLGLALEQARQGRAEGGLPIGAVLVRDGEIVGSGRNRRVQQGNPILHGEMDCIARAGRQRTYRDTTLYTTLAPCAMCAGTIVQFRIPRVVVGEDRSFPGELDFLRERGVTIERVDDPACRQVMADFITENPALWAEDIGDTDPGGP